MVRRDALRTGVACLAAGLLIPRLVAAQSKYPARPIRLVIPFGPGGLSDAVGRLWADKIRASLGPVFTENQGGAGGLIAAAAVARANADGYTILLGTVATQIPIPTAAGAAPYDAARDFEPISILLISALGIVIHPGVRAQTLQDFVAYAKANSDRLSYASTSAGSTSHMASELFKLLAGAPDIVHVPYKGAGQILGDIISGHTTMSITNVTSQVLELHRAGKIRLLAVTSPKRIAAAPDIPTAVEAGLPGMIAQNFTGLFAPAGTPKAIIAQIADATREAMADEEFRGKLIASGFEPYPYSGPEMARRFVQDEIDRWTPVIKAIGLKHE